MRNRREVPVNHMGSTDISLGSQGRSGRSGKVFKKGEGCCGIRQGTMLLSKTLYNGIYIYISGISGQIGQIGQGFQKGGGVLRNSTGYYVTE